MKQQRQIFTTALHPAKLEDTIYLAFASLYYINIIVERDYNFQFSTQEKLIQHTNAALRSRL